MVPYIGVNDPHKDIPRDQPWTMDAIALTVTVSIAALVLSLIGIARLIDLKSQKRHKEAGYKIKKNLVPGWVFRDRQTMALWLRMERGVEPEEWQVDLLIGIRDARIAAFKRRNIGKWPVGFEIMVKAEDEA